jgi:hypothetical protein
MAVSSYEIGQKAVKQRKDYPRKSHSEHWDAPAHRLQPMIVVQVFQLSRFFRHVCNRSILVGSIAAAAAAAIAGSFDSDSHRARSPLSIRGIYPDSRMSRTWGRSRLCSDREMVGAEGAKSSLMSSYLPVVMIVFITHIDNPWNISNRPSEAHTVSDSGG